MTHLHENIKSEMARLKHSKRTIIIGFGFFGVISAAIIVLLFLKVAEERETNQINEKLIELLKSENINLQKVINENKNQIAYLSQRNEMILLQQQQARTNEMILMEQRAKENQKQIEEKINRQNLIQPQIQRNLTENTFKPQEPSISNIKPYTPSNQNNIQNYTPRRMYQKYTSAKLVSDSKIEVMPDNRLKSSMRIVGRYIERPVATISCGKNQRIYNIVNECTGTAFPFDRVFYKKSNQKSIENVDRSTHMVECEYNYEHGIMHDCSVKLIGVR